MTTRPKNMTRDRERTIRPVLRQLLGRAVYLESRLADLGKLYGLPQRSHPKWGRNHATDFIMRVGEHSMLKCDPIVCQVTDAFLIEARRIKLESGMQAMSTARNVLFSQFFAFRDSQLREVFHLGGEFWPQEGYAEMIDMLEAACRGKRGDRLCHYRAIAYAE